MNAPPPPSPSFTLNGPPVVANAILKRLLHVASTVSPQCVSEVRLFVQRIAWDAKGVPVSERLAPRPTKPGTLDLTAGRIFATSHVLQAELISAVRSRVHTSVNWEPGKPAHVHTVLQVLLTSFRAMHAVWVLRERVSNQQLADYSRHVGKFAQAWRALSWKGTVWVHWVIAHSAHLLSLHGTISAFSSIPTEHKHKIFKVDVRHPFHGGRDRKRHLTAGGLAHVVNKHALDLGLALESANKRPRVL